MAARAGYLAVAFLSGFCILTVEFAAVRQLAPAFGQSITVWSTVIGVILVALAIGYALGGRLGERSTSARPLFVRHGIAAVWVLLAAGAGPNLSAALIPEGLPGDRLIPLGFTGSLVASIVLFAVPAVLMAMTSPFLIRLAARRGHEGRATGGIYAVGTLGSLLACYLAPLVLLQTIGTYATLTAVAITLGVLALLGLRLSRPGADTQEIPAAEPGPPVARGYVAVALITGLAVTILEFGAVRFMAPWVGQSNFIWATVIGVCLLALAMGSWLGGRWADAALSRGAVGGRHFYVALSVAAAWVGIATIVGPDLLEWLVPQGIESMRILPIAFRASMIATVLFFGPPLLFLGMAPPFLVRMGTHGAHAGRTAGVLFAWTTVGGLLGCFITSPLLVPAIGARGTLLIAALGLVAIALVALRPGAWRESSVRRATLPVAAALGLVPLALFVIHVAGRAPLRDQPGQIAEIESAYQTIRVVRQDVELLIPFLPETGAAPARLGDDGSAMTLFLRHDEDAETYQSLILEDRDASASILTGGRYFEHMALGAHFARRDPKTLRVLIIGHAGGTVYRTLTQSIAKDVKVTALGVEIDGAVVDVAREHLRHREIESSALTLITGEDARTVVNALPQDRVFDLVLVDAYARTNYVPFQLATTEFFEQVAEHLAPDGWVGVNVLGDGMKSPVANAVANTMSKALGAAYVAPNPVFPGNVILWSCREQSRPPRLQAGTRLHPGMQSAAFAFERLVVRHQFTPTGLILTDDLAPSDRLADEELGL